MKTNYLTAPVIPSGDQKLNNPIRRRWFALALGGFLFSSVFALPASHVEAQCQQWSVGHGWRLKQGPTNVDMNLHQNGTVITGTAAFELIASSAGGFYGRQYSSETVSGDVDGTVKGDKFAVIIHWNNNTTGVYKGTIGPSGRIEGTGYEQRSPSVKVNWHSDTHMECADGAAAPAAPATPKPIKSSGKAKPAPLPMNSYKADDPDRPRGFINGLQLATPTPAPSAEADESSSSDRQNQHKKNKKKNKKKHHHHDNDDENQDNN